MTDSWDFRYKRLFSGFNEIVEINSQKNKSQSTKWKSTVTVNKIRCHHSRVSFVTKIVLSPSVPCKVYGPGFWNCTVLKQKLYRLLKLYGPTNKSKSVINIRETVYFRRPYSLQKPLSLRKDRILHWNRMLYRNLSLSRIVYFTFQDRILFLGPYSFSISGPYINA